MTLFEVAKAVKTGARLLDKKVPGWRKILRKHEGRFDISDGDCCILGTLEHYSKQMQNLNKKRAAGMSNADYDRAVKRLNLVGKTKEHGFVWEASIDSYERARRQAQLNELWRAEFSE